MASTAQLDGLYKQLYPKRIEDAVPGAAHLLKKIPFTPKELQQGNFYNQPVILTQEQGWTYLPASSSSPTLLGNVDMQLKNAQVIGQIIAGQASLTVEAAKRAVSNGPAAFEDAIGLQMRVMIDSGKKRQEINFLYGQTALALCASFTNINASATIIGVVASEWATGFWAGMQNARFDAVASDNATVVNSTGPLVVVTSNAAQTTVNAVSVGGSVTFSGNTGDITAVQAYLAGANNNLQLQFYKALNNEAAGIKAQLTNSGTLFNISAASFDLWKGTTYTVPAPGVFSLTQLLKAIAKAVARGLDEEVDCYVNPDTFANLVSDQAALRMYTSAPGTFENGAEKLSFFAQCGKVNVIPHIYVKSGDAFVLPMEKVKRIGTSEMTFDIPGTDKGRIFIQSASSLSFEYRAYSQETIFVEMPARCVYVNGIVN